MTFSNPAYGPGTHVRCDVCRDPEALMEARKDSALTLPFMGSDEATWRALSLGFVRVGWRLLCGGCAGAELEACLRQSPEDEAAIAELCRVQPVDWRDLHRPMTI